MMVIRRLLKAMAVVALSSASLAHAEPQPRVVLDTGGHNGIVKALAFSEDGSKLVSAGDDGVIRIWDWRRGRAERLAPGDFDRDGAVFALALSPDGEHVAAAGAGAEIRLLSLRSGEARRRVGPLGGAVVSLAFSPDGALLASGSAKGLVKIWDLSAKDAPEPVILRGHIGPVTGVGFSRDGAKLVSVGVDGGAIIWDHASGAQVAQARSGAKALLSLALTPDRRFFVTGDAAGEIRRWRFESAADFGPVGRLAGPVRGLAITSAGVAVAGCVGACRHRRAALRLGRKAGEIGVYGEEHSGGVFAIAAHPSGRIAASGGGGRREVLVWDVQTGVILARLEGAGRPIGAVAASKDGRRIAWGEAWPVQSALAPFGAQILGPKPAGVAQSYVGTRQRVGSARLDSAPDAPLRVRIAGAPFAEIPRRAGGSAASLAPGGTVVLVGGDNGKLEKFLVNGDRIGAFRGHVGDVLSVATTADGRLLLSAGADQTLKIWSVRTRALLATLFHASDERWVLFTPEGYFTGSDGAEAFLKIFEPSSVEPLTRSEVARRFRRPERVLRALTKMRE